MKSLSFPITSALVDGGFTYPEFVQFTEKLVGENRTTGANQSEEYLGYTRLNLQRMGLIETDPKVFRAVYSEGAEKAFGRALPAETDLALKVGAQVMFIKNDDASSTKGTNGAMVRRWVNGTIGRVVALPKSGLVVVDVDGEELEVGPATWEKVRYEVEEDFDEGYK